MTDEAGNVMFVLDKDGNKMQGDRSWNERCLYLSSEAGDFLMTSCNLALTSFCAVPESGKGGAKCL